MKAVNIGNHPCPILLEDGGDYIGKKIKFTSSIKALSLGKNGETSKYLYRTELLCPPLQKLIENNDAKIVVSVEHEGLRKCLSYQEDMLIEIDPKQLKLGGKNIEITPLVVATKNCKLFYDEAYMDPIYGLFNVDGFAIEKGQKLGYGETQEIKTNRVNGLATILRFEEADAKQKAPFIVNYNSDDKIVVRIKREINDSIQRIQRNYPHANGIINSELAYPIFLQVITTILNEPNSFKDKGWYTAIKNKINENSKEEFNPETMSENERRSQETAWDATCTLLSKNDISLMETTTVGFLKDLEGR